MTKLSDTQTIILGAAAQREDRNILPLPGSLRGSAAAKVVGALLARGMIAEATTDIRTKAGAALNRVWRNDQDGCAILLHITDAGLTVIDVDLAGPDSALTGADDALSKKSSQDALAEANPEPRARTPRTGTKQAKLIEMLRAEGGATIDEIVASTGWQPHTVRGAFAGALKKRLGLAVTSEKIDGRGRAYRLLD